MKLKIKMITHAVVIGLAVSALGVASSARAQTIGDSFQATNSAGTNYFKGLVGIGTSTPPATNGSPNAGPLALYVAGSMGVTSNISFKTSGDAYLTVNTTNGATTGGIYIEPGGGVLGPVTTGSSIYLAGNQQPTYPGQIWLMAGNVASGNIYMTVGNYAYALTILHNGNVGIGTANPVKKFNVAGDGLFNGGLFVSNTLVVGTGTATGTYSVAEGNSTTASGPYSHAEGNLSVAQGSYSHAEGSSGTAYGDYSHVEGNYADADGSAAHAEGMASYADGAHSHAEGYQTMAQGSESHAAGAYATAAHEKTYVWSDGTSFSSTTNRQFSVCATNGIRLLGGPTVGVRGGDISMGNFTNMPPQ